MHDWERIREGGKRKGRESQAGSALSVDPNKGLSPTTPRSRWNQESDAQMSYTGALVLLDILWCIWYTWESLLSTIFGLNVLETLSRCTIPEQITEATSCSFLPALKSVLSQSCLNHIVKEQGKDDTLKENWDCWSRKGGGDVEHGKVTCPLLPLLSRAIFSLSWHHVCWQAL